jgi:YD repeat-containing protein
LSNIYNSILFKTPSEKDAVSNNYVRAMDAKYKNVCPGTGVSYDEGTSYKIYTYLLRPLNEIEKFYDPSSSLEMQSTTTSYTYTDKKLIRSVYFTNSDGNVNKTEYKYPFDFTGDNALTQMTNNNILSPIVEKTQYKNSSIVQKDYTDYGINSNNVYFLKTFSSQVGNNPKVTLIEYPYQDTYGNPLYKIENGSDKTVYIWGYKGQYPIAEISDLEYTSVPTNINFNTISSADEPSATDWTTINNLRTQLPNNAQVTTYTYKPLVGIQSMTDPRGVVTKYEYDAFGRLYKVTQADRVIETYDYHYKN